MTFSVGSKVVYPAHGVGEIISEEVQVVAGMDIGMFVISFPKDKMTLRVPVKRTKESGLRILSNDNEVQKAISVLKSKAKQGRGMWSRRAQEYEGKINSGDIVNIAEVVRDLYKNVDDPDRSYSERIIYESALGRLASEYAAVNGVEVETATDNLVQILKSKAPANSQTQSENDGSVVSENEAA